MGVERFGLRWCEKVTTLGWRKLSKTDGLGVGVFHASTGGENSEFDDL